MKSVPESKLDKFNAIEDIDSLLESWNQDPRGQHVDIDDSAVDELENIISIMEGTTKKK
jgi:hypothetical protein